MRSDSEESPVAQVPVHVVDGAPKTIVNISISADYRYLQLLSRYRRQLTEIANGTDEMIRLHGELELLPNSDVPGIGIPMLEAERIRAPGQWARELLGHLTEADPLGKLFTVNEDILGSYVYRADGVSEFEANVARIELYWCVIGLVSDWIDCTVEDLTVVVLAHELAHAYTQLGADIEGRRWPSSDFAKVDIDLREGLAQYYTHRVLHRLSSKLPTAREAFVRLLERQPAPYQAHRQWVSSYSPEAIRQAMLEARRRKERSLEQFNIRVGRAYMELESRSAD